MSWSLNLVGRPEKVVNALNEHGAKLDRNGAAEFEKAKPSLIALVNLNSAQDGNNLIQLSAWGSTTTGSNGGTLASSFRCQIDPIFGALL